MLLVAVVAFAFLTLVLVRPGLLRRRAVAAVFAVFGIGAALVANAVTHDSFLVSAACVIPVLAGMLLQEMLDGVMQATAASKESRRARRRSSRSPEQRERARRERERQRLAA